MTNTPVWPRYPLAAAAGLHRHDPAVPPGGELAVAREAEKAGWVISCRRWRQPAWKNPVSTARTASMGGMNSWPPRWCICRAGDGMAGCQWFQESSMSTDQQQVLFEKINDHVALVTLNRVAKRNAVNGAVTRGLAAAVERVEADPQLRVAILAASGDVFCAGADLAEMAAGRVDELSTPDGGFAGFVRAPRRKPWIAAVAGKVFGGGFELVLACDLCVAGGAAEFGLPEVKRGLMASAGGAFRIAQ